MRSLPVLLLAFALCPARVQGGFFPDGAFSDDARGLAGSQFLKAPPSARFGALAGAGLSLSGADSFFLNPAGTWGRAGALAVTYEALLEGSSRTGAVFSTPRRAGVFSAGFIYNSHTSGLAALDGAGGGDGSEITAYDAAFGAGWARRYGWVDAGVNLKYIRSRLAETSGESAALDAGLVFREPFPSRTELALTARNLGPPLRLGSEKAPLPFELGGGLKWRYTQDLHLLLEGRLPCDHAPYLVFAGEWFLPYEGDSGFFLRSGLNFKNYDDHGAMGAFAGGFGLKFGGASFDYAFSPYGELGSVHRLTAGLYWGAAAARRARPEPAGLPAAAVLAVAPFSGAAGVTETEAAVVRNLVESELHKTGRFKVVERAKLDFILAEKKLAYSGLSAESAAAEIGRVSGAGLAVFGYVWKDAKGYNITVSLADVSTAAVLRSETASVAEDYLFREAARTLSAALLK